LERNNNVNFVGSDNQCKFFNIPGHTLDYCQLLINFLMASRFSKQHQDLVGATLKKHITLMRILAPERGRPVNNLDMDPSLDDAEPVHDATTPEGGQVIQFDTDGLICYLTDDSALYQYESDNKLLHSCPFSAPIVHI
jgi:hypothetical protein